MWCDYDEVTGIERKQSDPNAQNTPFGKNPAMTHKNSVQHKPSHKTRMNTKKQTNTREKKLHPPNQKKKTITIQELIKSQIITKTKGK